MIGQTKDVANKIIDAKLAQEAMQEMRTMIDMRFGHGTWQSILDLRAKKIQEEKERKRLERKQRAKERQEAAEMWKNILITGTILFVAVSLFIFLFAVVL